ncbi:hypothetical protein RRG08_028316 [Elysia crispata]|uniref:Uncharacterized protein n=1 Tax=Elysia crispata TaxID=231223 RepID=A0AAE1AWJ9_9GAST|nr:hypothetical protein RRG08_028316 [Elysia crispata]
MTPRVDGSKPHLVTSPGFSCPAMSVILSLSVRVEYDMVDMEILKHLESTRRLYLNTPVSVYLELHLFPDLKML